MSHDTYSRDKELAISLGQLTRVHMRSVSDRILAKPLKPWMYPWEEPGTVAAAWIDIQAENLSIIIRVSHIDTRMQRRLGHSVGKKLLDLIPQ